MKKSKLALGFIATILSFSSIQAIADEAQEQSGALSTSVNVAVDESTAPKEIISVVGQPVYQNGETGVTVYAAPEPAPITVDN
ncbi:hypothetical protein JFT58_17940 [Pseudomonas sp. MF6767]|uniref:hypothetical protein n=1 Tax=Pseudomonas sp. MF6767 TaxID=2797531 RepID=UPI0018E73302|nr:hypothetical protein [Pseudomonas sp. MF6767]MBJ2280161.1 hypothetical protein [Pseudomonas sp. MF6767]